MSKNSVSSHEFIEYKFKSLHILNNLWKLKLGIIKLRISVCKRRLWSQHVDSLKTSIPILEGNEGKAASVSEQRNPRTPSPYGSTWCSRCVWQVKEQQVERLYTSSRFWWRNLRKYGWLLFAHFVLTAKNRNDFNAVFRLFAQWPYDIMDLVMMCWTVRYVRFEFLSSIWRNFSWIILIINHNQYLKKNIFII